jgi:hypothetical protein
VHFAYVLVLVLVLVVMLVVLVFEGAHRWLPPAAQCCCLAASAIVCQLNHRPLIGCSSALLAPSQLN